MAGGKGGRGGRGGTTGGFSLPQLLRRMGDQGPQQPSNMRGSSLTLTPQQAQGDYTDDNNPALVKWQGQTDDKSARFLAKVDNQTDLSQYQTQSGDKWSFYDNPFQKMVLQMNLNKPTTVLSKSDFDNYVNQTGATRLYRGWSGQDSADRFKTSPNSHVGNGINGDGYYFATDLSTAKNYGSYGMEAALSPSARVISATAVRAAMGNTSTQLQRALSYAGSRGTRTYGSNSGEAQMALKMGYNVIDAGWAVIPLTRDAVVVCGKRKF